MPDKSSPAAVRGQLPPEDFDEAEFFANCEPYCICDLEHTLEEDDWNKCDACGKPLNP